MRSKFVAAIAAVLSGTTAVLAQTKFSGTFQCGNSKASTIEEHVIEVGDRPKHSLVISKSKCTFAKPIGIAGTQAKGMIAVSFFDVIPGTEITARNHWTMPCANGKKAYLYNEVSGASLTGGPEEESPWKCTGGTGKLKGIEGKGTYKGKREPDGSASYDLEGEYVLPK